MSNLRPKGPKLIQSQFSKNKTLAREVAHVWDRKIPKDARQTIWPAVLSSLSSCLSSVGHIDKLAQEIQKISETKSLRDLITLKKQLSPQMFGDGASYFASAAVLNLFAKTELPIKGIDPLAEGVRRFHAAETQCRISNRRLRHYRQFDHHGRPLTQRTHVHEIFHLARRKIQNWLGPVSGADIFGGARHGPGGVVGLKRPCTTPYFKFAKEKYSCERGAYWYAVRAIASNDAWIRAIAISENLIGWDHNVSCIPYETRIRLADLCITITDQNEVTFVNKDALTKRSISIESEMGVYVQLGVGAYFKKCLARVGCDLRDQSRNQDLAKIGSSSTDRYDPVTLDLSMASDTMSIELVRELLPSDWFKLLDDIRSSQGSYLGKSFKWEKFSSMGNGFTFELESMIFYALAQASADFSGTSDWFSETFGPAYRYAYVSVYGDDIIVPQVVSGLLTSVLNYCGFKLNLEKSFVEGPFRESCGKDFWNGVDVRPFYFKRALSSVRDLIHLHNGIKWLSKKFDGDPLQDTLKLIRSIIPDVVERHLRGADPTLDDGYLWCEPDEVMTSKLVAWNISWQNWMVPTCGVTPHQRNGQLHWRYVQFLYSNTNKRIRTPYDDDDPVELHYLSGGSRGDIIESGRGDTVLTWVSQ